MNTASEGFQMFFFSPPQKKSHFAFNKEVKMKESDLHEYFWWKIIDSSVWKIKV